MEILSVVLAWVLVVIVPVAGMIYVVAWAFQKANTVLRAMLGIFGYLLVALPVYYGLLVLLASSLCGVTA